MKLILCAAAALALAGGAPASAATVRPGVTFNGKLERPGGARAQYQNLILDLAAVWANCDRALMARIFAEDVDFSYPTNRVRGRPAALADLDGFCRVATDRSIYFPADAFYIDTRSGRVAAEVQFRVTQDGAKQVVNDVWIATVKDGRIVVIKEYLDGRVKTLQAQGVLTYGEDAPFLTPWPPKVDPPPTAPK
jgi:ketosteroid isomerase-like protein